MGTEARASWCLTARPLFFVLSGPSGVGKDAVLTRLKQSGYPLEYIVTVTTRLRRPREKDNIDYHFISVADFEAMIERKELLEWAQVYGNRYGVPRKPVEQALAGGRDAMVKVDVQGAATIRKAMPQAVMIFLAPESVAELTERLRRRCTESPADIAMRNHIAGEEIKQLSLFDYVVVNKRDEIDRAVSDIEAIIRAEKCRVMPRGCR